MVTLGIQSACYSEPCDANDRVEAEIVASAKAWIRQRPACLSTVRRVMQQEQNRTAFVEDEEEACGTPLDDLQRPHEVSFTHVRDRLCASWRHESGPDGGSLHFARLQEHVQRLGLPDIYFPEQVCADPCQCSSHILEALGCKIQHGELLLCKGGAYCFVAEPEACTEGVTSPDHEGELWRPCASE